MPRNDKMKDLFGKAILDYQTNNFPENIITETNISEPEEMDVAFLFRSYDEMPKLEQKALQLATGKVLDIGCGGGSHSLYLQNEKKLDLTCLDISQNAIKTCELRGLKNTYVGNLLDFNEFQKFDTILLLMNGTGIFENLQQVPKYLKKIKSLLNPNGQILIDSSDIIYMYDFEDIINERYVFTNKYYGELTFKISYKGETEKPFNWVYIHFNLLKKLSEENGLQCEIIYEGNHNDYLAKLY